MNKICAKHNKGKVYVPAPNSFEGNTGYIFAFYALQ